MRSLETSVATSPSSKPPSNTPKGTLNETACFADKIVELTLSLGELLSLLRFEHNPIDQALLNEVIGVLLATITFVGKDANAWSKLRLLD